jgi:DNA-binding MarR family transcriptional regulator
MADAYVSLLYRSLRAITRSMNIYSRSLLKNSGVTGPQLSIMVALNEDGPLTISEVSKRIHLSRGTLTGTIHRMETAELITRTHSIDDRRKSTLHLAPKGVQILETVSSPLPPEVVTRLESGIPEWEQHMLLSAVQRLANLIQHEATDGLPVVDDAKPQAA